MIRLKDKSNQPAPQTCAFFIAQCPRVDTFEKIISTGWAIKTAENIEQRGVPRSGWTGDSQPFSPLQAKIHINQRVNRWFGSELSTHFTQFKNVIVRLFPGRHYGPFSYPITTN